MPAILLSIPKCESASLTNTNNRMESFLHPIFSCRVTQTDALTTALKGAEAPVPSRPVPSRPVPHPANSRLHDGVKPTLGQVDVRGHALLGDDLVESVRVARQRQHVFVAKRGQTGDV